MGTRWIKVVAVVLNAGIVLALSAQVQAARIADIRNTKHNFSSVLSPTLAGGASRVVSATTEAQICIFCHTPHAAEPVTGPIWNRKLSSATYETYRSGSIDATGPDIPLGQPTGISKLCLSCHDGTMAIGAVNVYAGALTDLNPLTEDIAMRGTSVGGTMAPGEGPTTGSTRFLGTNLTNDHPISMTFDAGLAQRDGEMRNPATNQYVKSRTKGVKPLLPLDNGMVQCNTCHDPHIRDNGPLNENIKFLRVERLQRSPPVFAAAFNPSQDIMCLACHEKAGWVGSAHAHNLVANEVYTDAAAAVREFPNGTQVWQTACLACHDPHAVQGSRRLTREGTDGVTKLSAGGYQIKQGGNPAIEETCYACHGPDRGTLIGQGVMGFEVPNVKTDFTTGLTHMPITTADQSNGANGNVEVHNIGTETTITQSGKDFVEARALLGNRHAECTDCHNPHRVIKNRKFNADFNTPDAGPTHLHDPTVPHNNLASGVLKGIWGVEPTWAGTDFHDLPSASITFTVKRGDPPMNGPEDVGQPYLTREYQLCFKCHSNYAYGDTPPLLGSFRGGTAPGTNGMTRYTNQAKEYNSPVSHQGEGTKPNSGASPGWATNNHRSWHPVVRETGRTPAIRVADPNNWVAPFSLGVGTQQMYCTDCHGNATAAGTPIPDGGENGNVWGPHGSANNFLLKGPWSGDTATGTGEDQPTHLCFKCHQYDQYANAAAGVSQNSGFALGGGMGCMMGGGAGGMGGAPAPAPAPGGGMGGAPAPAPAPGGMGGAPGGGGGGMMCMPNTPNNLHIFHAGAVTNFRCNLCHVAIPHGWKNKVFLNNLNDTGPEIGNPPGTQVRNNTTTRFVGDPYYNQASLKVVSFAISGTWSPANCGSVGAPGNGAQGVMWMAMSTEACINTP